MGKTGKKKGDKGRPEKGRSQRKKELDVKNVWGNKNNKRGKIKRLKRDKKSSISVK